LACSKQPLIESSIEREIGEGVTIIGVVSPKGETPSARGPPILENCSTFHHASKGSWVDELNLRPGSSLLRNIKKKTGRKKGEKFHAQKPKRGAGISEPTMLRVIKLREKKGHEHL